MIGIEPTWIAPLDPKSSASASFATPAKMGCKSSAFLWKEEDVFGTGFRYNFQRQRRRIPFICSACWDRDIVSGAILSLSEESACGRQV